MVFEVLGQKYKCGCGRGAAELIVPGILDKINELAEWDLIHFPKIKQHDVEVEGEVVPVMIEDREFLGTQPKLEPGNCILLDGQVIAFDSIDRIVLIVTETGGRSLERIYEEHIKPEWELTNEIENIVEFKFEELSDPSKDDEFDGSIPIPFVYYKVWKNLYLNGEEKKLLVTLNTNIFPSSVILDKWDCKYKTEEWDDSELDLLQDLVIGILAWFCRFNPRDNSWIDHEEETKKYIELEIEKYKCSLEESSAEDVS